MSLWINRLATRHGPHRDLHYLECGPGRYIMSAVVPHYPPLNANTIDNDWYDNVDGLTCEYVRDIVFEIPPELFTEWNPSVGVDCSNWQTYMSYCVQTWSRWSSMSSLYEATATKSSATVSAPTTTTTSSLAPSPTVWKDLGCFVENPHAPYVLQQNMSPAGGDANLSIPKCNNSCYRRSYRYAGVKEGNQCWCGTYVGGSLSRNQTDCNVPCSGDPTAICGGNGFINAFMAQDNVEVETLPQITSTSTQTSTLTNGGITSTSTLSSGGTSAIKPLWR
ncbi:hypothetical protein N0V85_002071 [Neurospora sp. IMI 360204]|nr:hypothetical protein N0V85_002071 [Neurospora sp. IMI 360204]